MASPQLLIISIPWWFSKPFGCVLRFTNLQIFFLRFMKSYCCLFDESLLWNHIHQYMQLLVLLINGIFAIIYVFIWWHCKMILNCCLWSVLDLLCNESWNGRSSCLNIKIENGNNALLMGTNDNWGYAMSNLGIQNISSEKKWKSVTS